MIIVRGIVIVIIFVGLIYGVMKAFMSRSSFWLCVMLILFVGGVTFCFTLLDVNTREYNEYYRK